MVLTSMIFAKDIITYSHFGSNWTHLSNKIHQSTSSDQVFSAGTFCNQFVDLGVVSIKQA